MNGIYLIRHGKTRANLEHRYCGSTDLPLSPEGISELRQLEYKAENCRFFTSGMRRANETLELLFGEVPYEVLPDFREIDFGVFEMHTYEELREDPDYQRWISGDNMRNVPPSGESGEQMLARVLPAFETLKASGQNSVLITHGGVIAAIMEYAFPNEGKNRYEWQPKPGHGYFLWDNGYVPLP